jgi:hypothetical protein
MIDIAAPPSEELLPSAGTFPRTPVPAPARALALDARRLLRRSADPIARPSAWSEPGFERQVAEVRDHLAPLRSRRALAASFGRESFHGLGTDAVPIRLAYAIRWLELGSPPSA